ncbi:MAG: hypothetical protein FWG73_02455 [Planctomycetaceae bacterium]|nr:hypothetical protein [Planctomycetaceae bacterium]
MEKHSRIQPEQMSVQSVEDDDERYRLGSVALRRKLGIVGNVFTNEQEKIYREEQRKLWLAINNPKKLEEEYGITEVQL